MSLFEDQTYENILARTLARISGSFDKREGSMVYNGVAPAAAELAGLYIGLDFVFAATYIATAPREYLIERAKDRGLSPRAASAAVFRAEFNTDVPVGTRFSCEELNFVVTERPGDGAETEQGYKVTCETAGSAANDCAGDLVPIEYVPGLSSAKLTDLLIPGDDEEETETFRQRVLDAVRGRAFGGNRADYKEKVLGIDGVAAVKVHPVWNGDISPASLIPPAAVRAWYESTVNTISDDEVKRWLEAVYAAALEKKLTVGGTVKLVIMAADNAAPSPELIDLVQTAIDPPPNAGEGVGLAPIGHVVTVEGVKPVPIAVRTRLTLAAGYTRTDAEAAVNAAVSNYFADLAAAWENDGASIVRISQIESRILTECSAFVSDIGDTTLDGNTDNVTLDEDSLPVLASGGVEIA